jgi:hypothetical protein
MCDYRAVYIGQSSLSVRGYKCEPAVTSGPAKGRERWCDPWLADAVDIGHVPTASRGHVSKTSWENASLVVGRETCCDAVRVFPALRIWSRFPCDRLNWTSTLLKVSNGAVRRQIPEGVVKSAENACR